MPQAYAPVWVVCTLSPNALRQECGERCKNLKETGKMSAKGTLQHVLDELRSGNKDVRSSIPEDQQLKRVAEEASRAEVPGKSNDPATPQWTPIRNPET